ncbi:hypothetical protein [Hymenobacter saemangeumensis]
MLVGAGACGSNNNEQPQMPYTPVNVSLTLTNQQYVALRTVNGTVVLPPGSSGRPDAGGLKGIIVVRQAGNSYLAFERNCPYRPFDACALVSVDRSGLFLRDSCCNSQFNLQGQVIGGPSPFPLRQYSTSLQGSQLNILN